MIASNLFTLQGSTEGSTGVYTDGVVVEVVDGVVFGVFLVGLRVETGEVVVVDGLGGVGSGPVLGPE